MLRELTAILMKAGAIIKAKRFYQWDKNYFWMEGRARIIFGRTHRFLDFSLTWRGRGYNVPSTQTGRSPLPFDGGPLMHLP